MYGALKRTYHWHHLAFDARELVFKCGLCGRHRPSQNHQRLIQLLPLSRLWEIVAIDFLGRVWKTKQGNWLIILMTSRYSRLEQTVSVPNRTASHVAVVSLVNPRMPHGISNTIMMDHGPQFVSIVSATLCGLDGTRFFATNEYHSHEIMLLERLHRTLVARLRHYNNKHQTNWDT